MISLLPDDAVIKLKELFDGKIEKLTQDELTALVTCYSENEINNTQLQYVVPQHRSDITKMLKKLCNEGFLIAEGNGRGTKYHINESEGKFETLEDKVESSENNMESSESNMESSESNMESLKSNMESSKQNKQRMPFEELQALIISLSQDYISIEEIATKVHKTPKYLINFIIPRMFQNGTIERLYPGIPNHPKQKYKATNRNFNKQ